jgi:hypothetical protein
MTNFYSPGKFPESKAYYFFIDFLSLFFPNYRICNVNILFVPVIPVTDFKTR